MPVEPFQWFLLRHGSQSHYLEKDIGDVFFTSVIDEVSFDGNLFIRFQKNLCFEFPNRGQVSTRVSNVRRQQCFVVRDTLKDARC